LADGSEGVGFSVSQLGTQAIGILAIGAFIFILSFILWTILKVTIGVRPSAEVEEAGLDMAETGVPSYPEFVSG